MPSRPREVAGANERRQCPWKVRWDSQLGKMIFTRLKVGIRMKLLSAIVWVLYMKIQRLHGCSAPRVVDSWQLPFLVFIDTTFAKESKCRNIKANYCAGGDSHRLARSCFDSNLSCCIAFTCTCFNILCQPILYRSLKQKQKRPNNMSQWKPIVRTSPIQQVDLVVGVK